MNMSRWASAAQNPGPPAGEIFEKVWQIAIVIGGHGLTYIRDNSEGGALRKTVAAPNFSSSVGVSCSIWTVHVPNK